MKIIKAMNMAEKWGIWEAELSGPSEGNPYKEVKVRAEFRSGAKVFTVPGFCDGGGIYKVRCMPDEEGEWAYSITSSDNPSETIEGSFRCKGTAAGKHGPVGVSDKFHFAYRDGAPYLPIGTTCYAWIHQSIELRS